MSAEAGITRSWKVGRFTCELTMPRPKPGTVAMAVCEWSPHVPKRMSASQQRAYRRGRNQAVAELSAELGFPVAAAEMP